LSAASVLGSEGSHQHTFRGVIPIVATPFREHESLDLDSWTRLLEFMVNLGSRADFSAERDVVGGSADLTKSIAIESFVEA